jgi:hypothetical protein
MAMRGAFLGTLPGFATSPAEAGPGAPVAIAEVSSASVPNRRRLLTLFFPLPRFVRLGRYYPPGRSASSTVVFESGPGADAVELPAVKVMASSWRRGVAIAFVVACMLDAGPALPQTTGADVILVLDSSGSMRDTPDARDGGDPLTLVDSADEGEVVGDDPASKLAQAKRVLMEVVDTAPPGVRFHLGKYRQSTVPADFGPDPRNRFLYATNDPDAAEVLINPEADGAAAPGLKRSLRDWRPISGVNTYYLLAGRFWNGQRIDVLPDGSQARVAAGAAGSLPAFVDVQRRSRSGLPMGPPVRVHFRGVRWNKANRHENPANRLAVLADNASCGGFVRLTSDTAEMSRFLGPELRIGADGSIDGYSEGSPGAPPLVPPREYGIRASGLTPLAGALADIRDLLASSWRGVLGDRTFVMLLTDGDDTCRDKTTGDVAVSTADARALRAAHKAQLLFQGARVPVVVVTFGTDVSARRSHWIAWGGSGLVRPTTGTGEAIRWSSPPTDADRAACASCRDALTARDAVELGAAVRKAIDLGLDFGRR